MNEKLNGVIQRKLALLTSQISHLEAALRGVEKETFKGDWVLRSMTERALQVAAEIMIDISERIIAIRGIGPVATAAEAIERLVESKALAFADPYVRIVGFRNLIVHRYEEIDPDLLFDLATGRLDDFRRFRDEIDRLAADGPAGVGG